MNKAMMSHDWKENYTALLAEVRQLLNATDAEGLRMHLENILDSFKPPDERDWCAMHVEGHCPCCGSHQCLGCGSPAGQILGHPIIENCESVSDGLSTWKCGHLNNGGCIVCQDRRVRDLVDTLEAARNFIIERHGVVLAITQIDEVLYRDEEAKCAI